jgi:4-hydroxybenzoyl-CoA thioesterase
VSGEVFTAEIKVRFADVDHAGIVYYPRFFHFFHVAMEELYDREFGKSYPDVLDVDRVGFPAVHTEADYRTPVRYGDTLRIRVTCVRIGGRSATLRYRAARAADGVECAEGRVTTACVDMNTFTSMDVPERYRTFLGRFLEN